jgi:hypothetical protein
MKTHVYPMPHKKRGSCKRASIFFQNVRLPLCGVSPTAPVTPAVYLTAAY